MQLTYKSDDVDDLLEGVITNSHKPGSAAEQPLGPVDTLVQEAMAKAKDETKAQELEKKEKARPLTQEEQWAKLMSEPDPLQEVDIYATEKKEEATQVQTGSPEEMDFDEDIGDLLSRSFNKERKRQNFV